MFWGTAPLDAADLGGGASALLRFSISISMLVIFIFIIDAVNTVNKIVRSVFVTPLCKVPCLHFLKKVHP
jgi:hypothetical protein